MKHLPLPSLRPVPDERFADTHPDFRAEMRSAGYLPKGCDIILILEEGAIKRLEAGGLITVGAGGFITLLPCDDGAALVDLLLERVGQAERRAA